MKSLWVIFRILLVASSVLAEDQIQYKAEDFDPESYIWNGMYPDTRECYKGLLNIPGEKEAVQNYWKYLMESCFSDKKISDTFTEREEYCRKSCILFARFVINIDDIDKPVDQARTTYNVSEWTGDIMGHISAINKQQSGASSENNLVALSEKLGKYLSCKTHGDIQDAKKEKTEIGDCFSFKRLKCKKLDFTVRGTAECEDYSQADFEKLQQFVDCIHNTLVC